jgi:hypothetical protein
MSDIIKQIPAADAVIETPDEVQPQRGERRAGTLRTLVRLSLGGTLLAIEALTDRLRQLEQEPTQTVPEPRDLESVLIPADEWETALRQEMKQSPRHVVLGLTLATQSRLSQTGGAILRSGGRVVGKTVDLALSPLRTSRLLSPARGRFETLVGRGQAEVSRWGELGRAEEARSRALAQTALDQLVEGSMDAVVEDSRIQVFMQEVVQEQSMGLVDEAIEEVRERTISGDYLLERFVRSRLRRPPREALPAPTQIIDKVAMPKTKGQV